MLKLEYLQKLLVCAIALSTITCAFIQKTKVWLKKSKYIPAYSLVVNTVIGIIFCRTFTDISFPTSLWIGFLSFLGADTLYKMLEGKLASHTTLTNKKTISIPKDNIINKEESNGKTNLSK